MTIYKLNTPVNINYNLDHARITEVLIDYQNSQVTIRWFREELNNSRHESKLTTLSGAEVATYRTNVSNRISSGENVDVAIMNAGYDALVVKESFPPGSIQ